MKLFLRIIMIGSLVLAGACDTGDDGNNGNDGEEPPPSTSRDAKTLTLQLADLPEGATEAGSVLEITPDSLEQQHLEKDIDDQTYQRLKDANFKSVAIRSFTISEEVQIFTSVAVFETEADAKDYFGDPVTGEKIEDAEKLGDESFTERIQSGPPAPEGGQRVIDSETIHTRILLGGVVIDVSRTTDPNDTNVEAGIDLAEKAAARASG